MAAQPLYQSHIATDAEQSRGQNAANIPRIDRRPWAVRIREACKANGKTLSPTDRLVAMTVASYWDSEGTWSVSVATIAEDTGLHRASVFRAYNKLREADILNITSGQRFRTRDRLTAGDSISTMPPAARSERSHSAKPKSHPATVESQGATEQSQGATRTYQYESHSNQQQQQQPVAAAADERIREEKYGDRAHRLCHNFRDVWHPKYKPDRRCVVNPGRLQRDHIAALWLCEQFEDDELETLCTFFLRIPDGAPGGFEHHKPRTLKWCLGVAEPLARKLKLKGRQDNDQRAVV